MQFQCSQYLGVLIGGFHDCRHNSLLQYAFFYGRRVVAVFLAVVKTIYTSPYDFLFAACRPSASAVWCFAFAADEQFCHSVFAWIFALLGFGFLSDLALTWTPCEFLLDSAEGGWVDNGRVTILYIVFRTFAVIYSDLFADAVGNIGLIDNGIALILFIGENGLYRWKLPSCFSRRVFDALFFK